MMHQVSMKIVGPVHIGQQLKAGMKWASLDDEVGNVGRRHQVNVEMPVRCSN